MARATRSPLVIITRPSSVPAIATVEPPRSVASRSRMRGNAPENDRRWGGAPPGLRIRSARSAPTTEGRGHRLRINADDTLELIPGQTVRVAKSVVKRVIHCRALGVLWRVETWGYRCRERWPSRRDLLDSAAVKPKERLELSVLKRREIDDGAQAQSDDALVARRCHLRVVPTYPHRMPDAEPRAVVAYRQLCDLRLSRGAGRGARTCGLARSRGGALRRRSGLRPKAHA